MGDVIDRTIHKILGTKHSIPSKNRLHGGKLPTPSPPPSPPKKQYFKGGYDKEGYFTPGYKEGFFNFGKTKKRSGGKAVSRMTGHSCDRCGHFLAEEEFNNVGKWDYKCKSCRFKYTHGMDLSNIR